MVTVDRAVRQKIVVRSEVKRMFFGSWVVCTTYPAQLPLYSNRHCIMPLGVQHTEVAVRAGGHCVRDRLHSASIALNSRVRVDPHEIIQVKVCCSSWNKSASRPNPGALIRAHYPYSLPGRLLENEASASCDAHRTTRNRGKQLCRTVQKTNEMRPTVARTCYRSFAATALNR